ncbi:MAG: hypothetical protein LBQ81_07125 [Zoogloeaceae bacterium]|jgi:hypothetical protein|nr:hypothetical protein [Zoogloeaceae bacterium]
MIKLKALRPSAKRLVCMLAFGGVVTLAAAVEPEAKIQSTFYDPVVTYVDLETLDATAGFSGMERQMQYLVSSFGDSSVDNHMCALGYRLADDRIGATVFWDEEGYLLRWRGSGVPPEETEMDFRSADSLALHSGGFRLDEALRMEDDEDSHAQGSVPGFFYGAVNGIGLHTQEDVHAEIARCKQHGQRYTIKAFALGPSIYAADQILARAPVVERHPAFSSYDTEIRYLVARLGNPQTENHFCVIGYQMADSNDAHQAVVIWTEGHRLLRWRGGNGVMVYNRIGVGSLYESATLDLNTGTLVHDDADTPEGIKTPARIEGTLADCQKSGRHDVVPPFTPPDDFGLPEEAGGE